MCILNEFGVFISVSGQPNIESNDVNVCFVGTVSVMYIMVFVAVKASSWGLHLDFNPAHYNMYIPGK